MENLNQPIDLTDIDKYYQDQFTLIQNSNGSYKGKWNWWAFFFTWIWCFTKGCWLFGIITLLTFSITLYKLQVTPEYILTSDSAQISSGAFCLDGAAHGFFTMSKCLKNNCPPFRNYFAHGVHRRTQRK
ncbi:MAG: DUF2628 domain-containing protein [Saprospiraceae bacterium]|uniref:DUF2628 domain-containing protein n=1 Tax=Candidatus Opimibacter skivensis TaxID=2982028 RepID=A0A9D7SW89_9BACT|nr:DUF2628 domain-containing protein [Candidatus Opimibacter skivensis]